MKKLVVVALLAVALAACGGKSSGGTTPATGPGQPPVDGTGGNTYGTPAALADGAHGATAPDDPSAASDFVDPCAPGE